VTLRAAVTSRLPLCAFSATFPRARRARWVASTTGVGIGCQTRAKTSELRVETTLLAADAKSLFLEGFLTRSGLILCLRREKTAEACSGRYRGRGRAGPPVPRVV